ncbi:MAG: hypothetical protein ACXWP6_19250, partial [Ktedonobacterales bacterium]
MTRTKAALIPHAAGKKAKVNLVSPASKQTREKQPDGGKYPFVLIQDYGATQRVPALCILEHREGFSTCA